MAKSNVSGLEVIGGLIVILFIPILWVFLVVTGTVWHAWVLKELWDWFVVTQFSVAPLTLVTAIGISLVADLLTKQYRTWAIKDSSGNVKEDTSIWRVLAVIYVVPAVTYGMGWLVHNYAHWLT